MWNSIVSVPDRCLFIYFLCKTIVSHAVLVSACIFVGTANEKKVM